MNYTEFIAIVRQEFPTLTPEQERQFSEMEGLYREWNAKINVISRKDMDEFYLHHVLHSLCIACCLPSVGSVRHSEDQYVIPRSTKCDVGISTSSILDIGTGGGFPGIPLAILFPDAQFTLCDSIGKKIKVAGEVARAIGLQNVTTVCCRAEELKGSFDYVVSRAVAPLEKLLPWTRGKHCRGVFCLKGGDIAEEIATACQKFRLNPSAVHPWPIQQWLTDEYFFQKFVIFIENICN